MMRFVVTLAGGVLIDAPARKIVAEAPGGHFCLLPRHADFVSAICVGLVCYETPEGEERFIATDEGILLKCATDVTLAVRRATCGADLAALKTLVAGEYRRRDERQRAALAAAARLEAGLVRRFIELGS